MLSETHTPKLAYSIREACTVSSLGKTTIYSLIATGRLKAVRVGSRTVIPADSLCALINGHTEECMTVRPEVS
jgi:excisionase family DNA binding protein